MSQIAETEEPGKWDHERATLMRSCENLMDDIDMEDLVVALWKHELKDDKALKKLVCKVRDLYMFALPRLIGSRYFLYFFCRKCLVAARAILVFLYPEAASVMTHLTSLRTNSWSRYLAHNELPLVSLPLIPFFFYRLNR